MTELEALKLVRKMLPAHLGEDEKEAYALVDSLIKQVEQADADPAIAIANADIVLRKYGRLVTFWVSEDWVIEYCKDTKGMVPNREELDSIADWLLDSENIGTSEAAAAALDEWMDQHWTS